MARKYTKMEHITEAVLKLQEQGKTKREIGEMYGLTKEQIKNLLYRYRSKENKIVETNKLTPKRKGRPRKKPITTKREMELEVSKLKMENELLRDFLQSIGRG